MSPESKKNKFFMLVGALFILLGLATLLYFMLAEETPTVPIEKQFAPIVFIDKTTFLEVKDFNKDKIAATVLNAVSGTLVKSGGVEAIYLTENKQALGLRRFIALIKGNFAIETLGNNALLVSDNFLMGVVNGEGKPADATTMAGKDFFMLIKVRSTTDVFDILRAWENKMFFDLHGFFGIDLTPENKYLLTRSFEDGIVENKNARILYQQESAQDGVEGDKKIVMMYILADDNSVIVTNTENAAHEIMIRLASSQIRK